MKLSLRKVKYLLRLFFVQNEKCILARKGEGRNMKKCILARKRKGSMETLSIIGNVFVTCQMRYTHICWVVIELSLFLPLYILTHIPPHTQTHTYLLHKARNIEYQHIKIYEFFYFENDLFVMDTCSEP